MHFLLLTSTYYPDKKSASFMLKTLAEDFISKNHNITIITFNSKISTPFVEENINGVDVIRIKVLDPKYSKIKRAFVELSYSRKIIKLVKSHKLKKVDGIIYYSPSIFFASAVSYLKKLWSVKSYLIVRDLFPDWLVKIGQMRKGLIYWFFKFFERKSFLEADIIGTESLADTIYARKLTANKDIPIQHLMNWFLSSEILTKSKNENKIISKNKVNLIYGGSLGLAQDIKGFLENLELLPSAQLLKIIIIGEGECKNNILEYMKKSCLDIELISMLDRKDYLSLVNQSDVGLVALDKNLEANNYPGKSFDYMYCSKPLFCYFNNSNEFGSMVREYNFGYFVTAGNSHSLEENINTLVYDLSSRLEKGKNAKSALNNYFSVRNTTKQIERSLTD